MLLRRISGRLIESVNSLFFAILFIIIIGVVTILGNESSFRFIVRNISFLSFGQISIADSSGSLSDQGELKNIVITTQEKHIVISQVKWQWQPSRLLLAELKVNYFDFANIRYENYSPATSFVAWEKPSNLSPLLNKINIDRLSINQLEIFPSGQKFNSINTQINLGESSIRDSSGEHWQLIVNSLNSPWGEIKGNLKINSKRPFNSNGAFNLYGKIENKAWQSNLNISGNLEQLLINSSSEGFAKVSLKAEVSSFATNPFALIKSLDLRVLEFNPLAHGLTNINANLTLAAIFEPIKDGYKGGISIVNKQAGSIFANKIPINLISGGLKFEKDKLYLQDFITFTSKGEVQSNGFISLKELAVKSNVKAINLAPWISSESNYSPLKQLDGKIYLTGNLNEPIVSWALNSEVDNIANQRQILNFNGEINRQIKPQPVINVKTIQLKLNNQEIFRAQGNLQGDQQQRFNFAAKFSKLNPQSIDNYLPLGNLNANIELQGAMKPNAANNLPQLSGRMQFAPSDLAGKAVSGNALINMDNSKIQKLTANLNLGGNYLLADAVWDLSTTSVNQTNNLKLKIDAQQLGLLGRHFSGRINGDINASGSVSQPNIQALLNIRDLVLPGNIQIGRGLLNSNIRPNDDFAFNFDLQTEKISFSGFTSDKIIVNASGNRSAHRIQTDSQVSWQQIPYKIASVVEGKVFTNATEQNWSGQFKSLEIQTKQSNYPQIKLLQPTQLSLSQNSLKFDKMLIATLNGQILIDDLHITRNNGLLAIQSRGQAQEFDLRSLKVLYPLKWDQQLVLDALWEISWQENQANSHGVFSIQRRSGDIRLESLAGVNIPLRLLNGKVSGKLLGDEIKLQMLGQSKFGQIIGNGKLDINSANVANSQINIDFETHLARLGLISLLLDQTYELDGEIVAKFQLNESLNNPHLSGTINGKNIVYGDHFSGVRLVNGQLNAEINGKKVTLSELSFANPNTAPSEIKDGKVSFSGIYLLGEENLQLNLLFKKYLLINRPQSYLIASGNADLIWNTKGVNLIGKIIADQGRYFLPDASAPALSADVNVIRNDKENAEIAATNIPFEMNLQADLGNNFLLNGQGINANLIGKIDIIKKPEKELTIDGEIKIVQGRYKAYGQDLDIKNGSLNFSGAYDNPVISLLAKRRVSQVGAGVEVSGYLRQAKIKIYADEAMDDRDKLSWLVLGRASTGSADDNSGIAAAAGSFLASGLNDQIGLFDDISLNQRKIRYHSDGSVSPAEQIFVVGKQISRDLYLGYEYGMNTAKQAAKAVYQINRYWSVVGSIGDQSSQIESRWSWRFD